MGAAEGAGPTLVGKVGDAVALPFDGGREIGLRNGALVTLAGATMDGADDTSVLLLLVGAPLPVGANVELVGAIDEGALLVVVLATTSGVGAMVVVVALLVVLVGLVGLKVLKVFPVGGRAGD
jgi:hypothetical protein